MLEGKSRSTRENALLSLPLARSAAGRALAAGHLGHAHAALDGRVPPRGMAGDAAVAGRLPDHRQLRLARRAAHGRAASPTSIRQPTSGTGSSTIGCSAIRTRCFPGRSPDDEPMTCTRLPRSSWRCSRRRCLAAAAEPPAKELFGAVTAPAPARRCRGDRQLRQGLPRRRQCAADRRPGLAGHAAVAQPRLGPSRHWWPSSSGWRSARATTAGRASWSATWRSRGAARCAPATPRTRSGSTSTCG